MTYLRNDQKRWARTLLEKRRWHSSSTDKFSQRRRHRQLRISTWSCQSRLPWHTQNHHLQWLNASCCCEVKPLPVSRHQRPACCAHNGDENSNSISLLLSDSQIRQSGFHSAEMQCTHVRYYRWWAPALNLQCSSHSLRHPMRLGVSAAQRHFLATHIRHSPSRTQPHLPSVPWLQSLHELTCNRGGVGILNKGLRQKFHKICFTRDSPLLQRSKLNSNIPTFHTLKTGHQ